MKTFQYVIKDEVGIHARPAALLAKEAGRFGSKVMIKKGEKSVEANRMMMVMGLGVKCGEEITVIVDGMDEEDAYAALKTFFEKNL